MDRYKPEFTLRPGYPNFRDLPWDCPLDQWHDLCEGLEEMPHGISKHTVIFISYDGVLCALKELPHGFANLEYESLYQAELRHLPSVTPVGYVDLNSIGNDASILITRYLDHSLPYRTLFMNPDLDRYRHHLLDAMAELLVQLHLSGFYWGDCSLSNTLFRRDAGSLQAYLVDAESAEVGSLKLSPALRFQELETMEKNLVSDLVDMASIGILTEDFPIYETGSYIRQRYHQLWNILTHEKIISPTENYRIHEHVRAINALGYSVKDITISPSEQGDTLRMKVFVSDRGFYRDQLQSLTGLSVEEMQAQTLMNEVLQLKATLSRDRNQDISVLDAAKFWLEGIYQPVVQLLQPLIDQRLHSQLKEGGASITDPVELYCQVLEHKWYLSERAQHDVGHQTAVMDYLHNIAKDLQNTTP